MATDTIMTFAGVQFNKLSKNMLKTLVPCESEIADEGCQPCAESRHQVSSTFHHKNLAELPFLP